MSPESESSAGVADAAIRSLLLSVSRWTLSAEDWDQVGILVVRLRAALAAGNPAAVDGAATDLARAAVAYARRFGGDQDPQGRPAPPPVRQLVNVLIHELGGVAPDADDLDDARTREDASPTWATGGDGPAARSAEGMASTRGERRLHVLPLFTRGRIAFAATDPDRGGEDDVDEVALDGMRIVRRTMGPSSVDVLLIVGAAGGDGDVVAATLGPEEKGIAYLMPLWRDPGGNLVGGLELPTRAARVGMSVSFPFPASSLTDDDIPAIGRSCSVTTRSGRNAWRAIARSRPDDAVRAAIAEGLR
ncbi:hypothetical protein I6A84_42400 [Frankia sp. CNm7]|uniref:CATRA-Associated Small Protein domain-containing protein n=1 Tax=Frankia nepalensis TaxID=1836974 RepID=A0A937RFW5_9ACTN|nr:CATRA system-associated protein [Frankia nepalensis]MBL7514870.1 hypothetical protein [Frankia nepalensis]MBL7524516.1 hypothetical protein [Frankia nepalensis]MBL7631428.1 hypothetical protein [Frankia nepalensis]